MLNEEKSRFARKTKLTISFLLGLLTLAFIYDPSGLINKTSKETSEVKTIQQPPVPPANNNITNNFLIGSLSSVVNYDFQDVNDLGLNMWHSYTGGDNSIILNRHVPTGWRPEDIITNGIDNYKTGVWQKLDSVENNNGMRSFMQRPKIEWLCYGQRSDYECEPANYVNSDLFFYTFQQHETGMPVPDSGGNSVFCRVENSTTSGSTWHNPGFVVKRLKCNTEQSKPSGSGNQWQGDEESDWLIKPRIRIDSNVAHNKQNMNVCKIIVINQRQDTIKNLIIKAGNFLREINGQFFYNGQYLEEYFFGINDSNLTIHGNWGNLWEWRSRGDWNFPSPAPSPDSLNDEYYRSKVDLQVYWYGNCDMWIDRVRVDNDVAHNLLGTGQTHDLYNDWIEQEATVIAGHNGSPLKFYIELAEFNNIPCIAYVNEKLQSQGRVVDMVTDVTYYYALHVNWDNGPEVYNAGHIW